MKAYLKIYKKTFVISRHLSTDSYKQLLARLTFGSVIAALDSLNLLHIACIQGKNFPTLN